MKSLGAWERRSFSAAVLCTVAGLTLSALPARSRPDVARVSVAVGGRSSLYYLPLALAVHLGYFKAEGLDVSITDFPGGGKALKALVAGEVDMVAGAYEHTIVQQVRGVPCQSFVLLGRAPQITVGMSTRSMPRWSPLADLRGRRIGVSSHDSSTHMVVRLLLRKVGLGDADVDYVEVGTSREALAALQEGRIDAISNVEPVITMLELKGDVRIVADTRTLKGTKLLFGGPMPSGCMYAPLAFIQRNPWICQSLANAIVRALKWLRTAGPSDLIQVMPRSDQLGDAGLYLAAFERISEAFSNDGLMPEDGPGTALRALAVLDPTLHADRVDLAGTFSNRFARIAKTRLRA